jgi:thiamine-phosphate pyrophosphorylase
MVTQTKSGERAASNPRLYLVTPRVTDLATLRAPLIAALEAVEVAAVLLRLVAADERTLINQIKALAPAIQDRGAALLLEDHAGIVARAGADGAHLTDIDTFDAARPALQPDRIAGCGGLVTRHDAMTVGEAGADYVMFGEPDVGDDRAPFDEIIERIAWWAEVFEIPCVGFAAAADEIGPIVAAGADFVAVGPWIFEDPRGPALAAAEAAKLLEPVETSG